MNYREIDISAWRQVGEGGNGKVFDNPSDPGVILKVNKKGLDTLEFAQKDNLAEQIFFGVIIKRLIKKFYV
ncbi:MAG: hypothetical protein K5909_03255 [Bacteroidales bacterium]|nr:hypothetical protein [Bacteroidales bacterium]